jgi:hypothetical protein
MTSSMQQLKISCHHGDIHHQNNLPRVERLIETYPEIDIYEIDFISLDDKIISSHDYDMNVIKQGSELDEWVRVVVLAHKKILWLDIKENLALYCACGFEKFDHRALFRALQKVRDTATMDLTPYIWIGCQDVTLRYKIFKKNGKLVQPWQMILDMPTVSSYIAQRVTPKWARCYLREAVCDDFRATAYEKFPIISIDQSFFQSRDEIKEFIRSLGLTPQTVIVLNSFDRSVAPITMKNHYIVMQYDYTA